VNQTFNFCAALGLNVQPGFNVQSQGKIYICPLTQGRLAKPRQPWALRTTPSALKAKCKTKLGQEMELIPYDFLLQSHNEFGKFTSWATSFQR
jgi:hypothetical protein